MSDRFRIRLATKDDARLLYEWRNDESTRSMSKKKEQVHWDEHLKWLNSRLSMEQPNLFIFEVDGDPVGTFRIDEKNVSYTVAPNRRNEGIAKKMLTEVRARFGRLRAQIYAQNVASIKAAQTAGLEVAVLQDLSDQSETRIKR